MRVDDQEVAMQSSPSTAVVTGAGSGIGRATALRLAARGDAVVVADIDEAGGRATVEAIAAAGGTATFVSADVADESAVQAMVRHAVDTFGRLDLAVNNAGIAHAPTDLHQLPAEDFDRVIAVDLRGTFLCLKHEIAAMLETGGGRIVNVASNAGVKNAPDMAGYTAAKHGVVGLTKNVALQYARRGIRLNAICPGTVLTEGLAGYPEEHQAHWREMVPTGRLGQPDDVAGIIAFLLSDEAEMIQAAMILADGGLMYA
jgi:NAD(P)-dependent dehydrogenase (short-subunit alcohol dehydrogenase family)